MAPKITSKSASEPKACPEASREPFGHIGPCLASFWAFLLGAHVRAFSGCTFASFCLLLVYCWCSFSHASSAPLLAF